MKVREKCKKFLGGDYSDCARGFQYKTTGKKAINEENIEKAEEILKEEGAYIEFHVDVSPSGPSSSSNEEIQSFVNFSHANRLVAKEVCSTREIGLSRKEFYRTVALTYFVKFQKYPFREPTIKNSNVRRIVESILDRLSIDYRVSSLSNSVWFHLKTERDKKLVKRITQPFINEYYHSDTVKDILKKEAGNILFSVIFFDENREKNRERIIEIAEELKEYIDKREITKDGSDYCFDNEKGYYRFVRAFKLPNLLLAEFEYDNNFKVLVDDDEKLPSEKIEEPFK